MAIDYRQVLKELRDEESRLEAELEVIRSTIPGVELMASRTPEPYKELTPEEAFGNSLQYSNISLSPGQASFSIQGPYTGMGTKQAILTFLRASAFPQMPSFIAKSLLDGGIVTRSSDFASMVATTLAQMKSEGLVERLENGWRLVA